jgi:quercetin dioxygenase-like cupin family protein
MRKLLLTVAVLAGAIMAPQSLVPGHSGPLAQKPAGEPGPKLETLLKAVLDGVDGTEVIVSRVTIPPNTSLPKHWHPGEEFAYVLEGSVTLWQKGKDDIVGTEGDVMKVPLKQVHTAITKDEGATILVFRVHEQGQPERVPAEDE